MANENDISREMEELRRSLQDGAGSADSFGTRLKTAGDQVYKSMVGFGKQLASGDSSFSSLNTVVDGSVGAMKSLTGNSRVLNTALDLVASTARTAAKNIDDLNKSYLEIAQSGAAAADGMTGLKDQVIASGIGIKQFTRAVAENSQVLAKFGGTTGAGIEKFSKAVGDLAFGETSRDLRALGFSTDQIANTAIGFIKQQTLLGQQRTSIENRLREGTVAYATELDLLARVTGVNRKDLDKQRQQALMDNQFAVVVKQTEAQYGKAAADQLLRFQQVLGQASPSVSKAVQELSAGIVRPGSEAAKLIMSIPDAMQIVQGVRRGEITAGEAFTRLQPGLKALEPTIENANLLMGDQNKFFIKSSELYALQSMNLGQFNKAINDATAAQKSVKYDQLTDRVTQATQDLEKMGIQFKNIGLMIADTLSPILSGLTTGLSKAVDVLERFSKFLYRITGGSAATPAPAPATPAPATPAPSSSAAPSGALTPQQQREQAIRDSAKNFEAELRGETPPAGPGPGPVPAPSTPEEAAGAGPGAPSGASPPSAGAPPARGPVSAVLAGPSVPKLGSAMPMANFLQKMGVSAAESIMGMMGDSQKTPDAAGAAAAPAAETKNPASTQKAETKNPASTQKILDLIGRYESRGGSYNVLVGGRVEPNLTSMTISEVLEYQRDLVNSGAPGSAAGKYQIIRNTLADLVNRGVANPNERFSPATQDRLAIALMEPTLSKFQAKQASVDQMADKIAAVWAAFPKSTGQSQYQGVGNNKAGLSRQEFIQSLGSAKFGGVISGPESGYQATLHGTEAVIPLAGGRTLPMEMPGLADSFRSQMTLMSAQIEKLDELIDVVRNGNAINRNMLKAARA
jgi:muramidase (phage lysozyme)